MTRFSPVCRTETSFPRGRAIPPSAALIAKKGRAPGAPFLELIAARTSPRRAVMEPGIGAHNKYAKALAPRRATDGGCEGTLDSDRGAGDIARAASCSGPAWAKTWQPHAGAQANFGRFLVALLQPGWHESWGWILIRTGAISPMARRVNVSGKCVQGGPLTGVFARHAHWTFAVIRSAGPGAPPQADHLWLLGLLPAHD